MPGLSQNALCTEIPPTQAMAKEVITSTKGGKSDLYA